MLIINNTISLQELKMMSEKMFGSIVKAVVDIEKGIMVVDADLHADEEEQGSEQQNLWGINIHPDKTGLDFIEFDSMINLRPSWGNKSRGVDNAKIQEKIRTIINHLVTQ